MTPQQLEELLLIGQYGAFLALWSTFDATVEVIIMRTLRLTPEEASMVCAPMSFGGKANLLYSLLERGAKNTAGIKLIKEAARLAERNSFAHGFLMATPDAKMAMLVRRDVKDKYSVKAKPLNLDAMGEHYLKFRVKFEEIRTHFNITDDDQNAYLRSILRNASIQESPGVTPHHGGPTNSETANPKQQRQQPRPSPASRRKQT